MEINCCSMSTKHGSVVVGAIFFAISIAAGVTTGVEWQSVGYHFFFTVLLCSIEITIMFVGIFSILMAVGAVLEKPTLMFPWLGVILTFILNIIAVTVSVLGDTDFTLSKRLESVAIIIAIIVVTSLCWFVVYHRYHRLISPKTTRTVPEKSLDKEYKDILTYHRFNNDNTV